jgi:hypothetical protein
MHDIEEVVLKADGLQGLLIGADYTILLYTEPGELAPDLVAQRVARFLARTEVWRERERKGEKYIYNLRPLVFELHYEGYDPTSEEHRIFLRVQQRAGATGRPDEVVSALGFDDYARTLRRDRLYFKTDPVDVAVFAAYPEVHQAEIDHPENVKRARRAQRAPHRKARLQRAPGKTGRSISE